MGLMRQILKLVFLNIQLQEEIRENSLKLGQAIWVVETIHLKIIKFCRNLVLDIGLKTKKVYICETLIVI